METVMSEQVVLVDEYDNQIGLMDKLEAHRGEGTLHRAISVLLYRIKDGKKELLLQQRSKEKPLWPLFWTNTVCTHPRDGEVPVDCAVRRLSEEMGIRVQKSDLRFVYKLLYQARYNEQFSEHELDHVFVGRWDGQVMINVDEVNDYRWIELGKLNVDLQNHPDVYTPWFLKITSEERMAGLFM